MERVIASVKPQEETRSRDLEISVGLEIPRPPVLVTFLLRWGQSETGEEVIYQNHAYITYRFLRPEEALERANILNDTLLTYISKRELNNKNQAINARQLVLTNGLFTDGEIWKLTLLNKSPLNTLILW